ncbi:MAG: hypothetical protein LBQ90_04805 [Synergistaceae bacterium]|jgi:hypothetical protein|nr:hypothetical protein [Synergistaceae bacterium]
MKSTEIIETLRQKLTVPVGRHLYGVLGTYSQLDEFAKKLHQARTTDGVVFPKPTNVNRGILGAIPDDEFKRLAENEAKRPEPTAAHVGRAFERFLNAQLAEKKPLVLSNLEMLFAYHVELSLLRTRAADENRVVLLLPGRKSRDRIVMFHEMSGSDSTLPTNLIAENHLWEIGE